MTQSNAVIALDKSTSNSELQAELHTLGRCTPLAFAVQTPAEVSYLLSLSPVIFDHQFPSGPFLPLLPLSFSASHQAL